MHLPSDALGEMIEKTHFCRVSTDETRLSLGGVFIESVEKNQIRMVATDGHRLALVEREVAGSRDSSRCHPPSEGSSRGESACSRAVTGRSVFQLVATSLGSSARESSCSCASSKASFPTIAR